MGDLNLNFDTGLKNISMTTNQGDNLGFNKDTKSFKIEDITSTNSISPNLRTADPIGVEMLAVGGSTSPQLSSPHNTMSPKNEPVKSEEFSFFKSEDKGGIIDGDLPNDGLNISSEDSLLMSQEGKVDDGYKPIHRLTPQEIKNEKIDLIYKFKKLEQQGIRTTMNYNMNSHLEDMRNEFIKLKKQREIDNAVKFQRKMLMACVTGVEFLNSRFDPFAVKLDGWGETVNESINDYDEIFEELNEKYGGRADVAPEIKLMLMVGGSAFMFHLTNTMFKTSLPGMDDIMKQNPELMQQFAKAAVNTPKPQPQPQPAQGMGMDMGGLMSGLMGGGMDMGSMMGSMMGQGQQGQQGQKMPPKRNEMKGSDDIDDIINNMNIDADNIDLDNISIISGDSDKGGITLNI